jgi:AcrR family transcriptional regulator
MNLFIYESIQYIGGDGMGGLRERKKKESEERIQKAAKEVFRAKGYAGATMEEIARIADIGVGTLYNYYKSKAEIFLSIVTGEFEPEGEAEEQFEADVEKDVADNVSSYLLKYFKGSLLMGKKFWRETMAAMFNSAGPGKILFKGIAKLDFKLIDKLQQLLEKEIDRGKLSPSFNAADGANAIYGVLMMQFFMYVFFDEITVDEFTEKFISQIRFIFEGKSRLRKNGE